MTAAPGVIDPPARPASGWLGDERTRAAADKILDAAAAAFAADGVSATNMAAIARAAGCSRATVYRYFPTREHLHRAFVRRAARRLGRDLDAGLGHLDDPAERLTAAVLAALRAVRTDPSLAPWFAAGEGVGLEAGLASDAVTAMAAAFTADLSPAASTAVEVDERARWLVRVIVSLLAAPGRDADHERAMIERFVVPVIVP